MQCDENSPTTHTRRYRVATSIGIGAMALFALLSVLLLVGVICGPPSMKPHADALFPWSLLMFALAGVAMLVANTRRRDEDEEGDGQ